MSESNEVNFEKIQHFNQLLEETLASRSKEQLVQLVRLLGSSIGTIRVGQSEQEKIAEAQQRVAMAQAVAAGDQSAIEKTHQMTVAAITEILSALNVLQEQDS